MYFIRDHAKVFIALAIALALAAAAAVWFFVLNGDAAKEARAQEKASEPIAVAVKPTSTGWDENTSTPLIMHVDGEDLSGASVSYYKAISAVDDSELNLAAGTYKIDFISPVNADGSIYEQPHGITLSKENEGDIAVLMELVSPENVSQSMADDLIKQIGEAVAFGDETLSGARGKTLLNKAKANIRNAPNVGAVAGEAGGVLVNDANASSASEPAAAADTTTTTTVADRGQGQAAASTPTTGTTSVSVAQSTGNANANQSANANSNASANANSNSSASASSGSKTKWTETTFKTEEAKTVKWVERDDGTGYFEEVSDGESKTIDVAGHWD